MQNKDKKKLDCFISFKKNKLVERSENMKRLFRISLWFSMILYLLLLSEFVLFKYFSVQEILQHFMLKNEGTPFFVK